MGGCEPEPEPASVNTEGVSLVDQLHVTFSLSALHKCPRILRLQADGVLFVPPGEQQRVGVSPVAPRAEPLLLQAADEPCPLSILLPSLLVRNTRARPHVPFWRPVARSPWETTTFLYVG